jgi:uncharacterized membrane protein (DUF373 family)
MASCTTSLYNKKHNREKGESFMSEDDTNTTEQGDAKLQTPRKSSSNSEDRMATVSSSLLDRGDSIVYTIVGVCFFLGALFALGYSFWNFGALLVASHFQPVLVGQAIIQFISDLLLVLIIMEVLGTVTHYLRERATSLHPFLYIGIISATRGILSIGARLSVEGTGVSNQVFNNGMIELGVSGVVILALGFTIKLLGKLDTD